MKLIVGLGNPGLIYAHSRHNIGFSVIKAFARLHKVPLKKERDTLALCGKALVDAHSVVLALPLTYMNLSGVAVASLVKKHRIDLEDVLVVCDDLDLELGRLKIRPSGSSGGHNGLKSIIDALGSKDFARLRIGIGRPSPRSQAREYVLSGFSKKERPQVEEIVRRAVSCSEVWVDEGITNTMNIFNQRSVYNE